MAVTKELSKKTAKNVLMWLDYDGDCYIWDRKNPDYDQTYLDKEIKKFRDPEYCAEAIATRIFDMRPNFDDRDYDELKEVCGKELFELAIRYYVTSNHST